jgi:trimeric autotransporter adhesin
LSVVEVERGVYVVDDTSIPDTPEQAAARKARQAAQERARALASNPIALQAAQAAQQAAQQAAFAAEYENEFAPWLHYDARFADGSPATFDALFQADLINVEEQAATLTAQNAAELTAGLEDAISAGIDPFGTNQLGGPLVLQGTGYGLGWVTTFNTESADTISTDEIQPGGSTGLALTGTNTVIGEWEAGLVFTNHQEFTNGSRRVFELESNSRYSVIDHSTFVAGTLAAKGVTNAAKGMAYQSIVRAWDADNDTGEMLREAATNSLRVSNHSYGRGCGWAGTITFIFTNTIPWQTNTYPLWDGDLYLSETEDYNFGLYEPVTAAIDSDVYQTKYYLPVWAAANERGPQGQAPSAGPVTNACFYLGQYALIYDVHPNDYDTHGGYDLLPPQQVCKNGLTVGAVSNIVGGFSGSNSIAMSTFSSWGPTDDGRMKPDIVAAGVNIYSCGTNNRYLTDSGTSYSAPAVAGSLDLLVQRQSQLYGTNPPMFASTLRGLAIHTADDADGSGPDYKFGWGLFNARTAALLIESNYVSQSLANIKEVRLTNGDCIEFPAVATNNKPLRVTICWTDPPGTPPGFALNPTNRALVNDLDLRVVSTGGATNFPWVLNPASPATAATTGDNFRDNVERVDIATPTSGAYTIRVSHKGNLVNSSNVVSDQWVSILLSGNLPQPQPALTLGKPLINGTNAFLKWPSVVGRTYRVQYKDNLSTAGWTDATGEISSTKTNVAVNVSAASVQRFYRVVQVR